MQSSHPRPSIARAHLADTAKASSRSGYGLRYRPLPSTTPVAVATASSPPSSSSGDAISPTATSRAAATRAAGIAPSPAPPAVPASTSSAAGGAGSVAGGVPQFKPVKEVTLDAVVTPPTVVDEDLRDKSAYVQAKVCRVGQPPRRAKHLQRSPCRAMSLCCCLAGASPPPAGHGAAA